MHCLHPKSRLSHFSHFGTHWVVCLLLVSFFAENKSKSFFGYDFFKVHQSFDRKLCYSGHHMIQLNECKTDLPFLLNFQCTTIGVLNNTYHGLLLPGGFSSLFFDQVVPHLHLHRENFARLLGCD
jgi:hypothetical protein